MLILCERCVKMLKSRGETVFKQSYSKFDDAYKNAVCDFCDSPDFLSGVIIASDELKFN